MPVISVIIAVYNTECYLDKCIQSVLNQTFTDWELICVDDGSTDHSSRILQNYAAQDNRIKVYEIPHSGLHARVMNVAVGYSKGEYIYSLDSDDYISQNTLKYAYDRIVTAHADVCLNDLYRVDEDGRVILTNIGLNGNRKVVLSGLEALSESLCWNIHSLGLWKRSLFADVLADEDGYSIEYTIRKRYLKCDKVVFAEGIYYYVQHENAITKRVGPRLFYYVLLDKKVLELLKANHFERKVVVEFEVECLKNLFYKGVELVKRYNQLDVKGRNLSKGYLREAYEYYLQDQVILKEAVSYLSRTKRFVLSTRCYTIYYAYCWLKSFS